MEKPTGFEQGTEMAMQEAYRAVVIATANGQEEDLSELKIRQPINKNNEYRVCERGLWREIRYCQVIPNWTWGVHIM
jgi:hypothetical protein